VAAATVHERGRADEPSGAAASYLQRQNAVAVLVWEVQRTLPLSYWNDTHIFRPSQTSAANAPAQVSQWARQGARALRCYCCAAGQGGLRGVLPFRDELRNGAESGSGERRERSLVVLRAVSLHARRYVGASILDLLKRCVQADTRSSARNMLNPMVAPPHPARVAPSRSWPPLMHR